MLKLYIAIVIETLENIKSKSKWWWRWWLFHNTGRIISNCFILYSLFLQKFWIYLIILHVLFSFCFCSLKILPIHSMFSLFLDQRTSAVLLLIYFLLLILWTISYQSGGNRDYEIRFLQFESELYNLLVCYLVN